MASTDTKTTSIPPAIPTEPKWNEYRIFYLDGTLTANHQRTTETMLCQLAAEGWEFVWGDSELRSVLMGRHWENVPVIPDATDAVPEPRTGV